MSAKFLGVSDIMSVWAIYTYSSWYVKCTLLWFLRSTYTSSGCGLFLVDKKRLIIICIIVGKTSHAEGVVCHFVIGNVY